MLSTPRLKGVQAPNGGRSPRLAPIASPVSPREMSTGSPKSLPPSNPFSKYLTLPTLDRKPTTLLPEGPYLPNDIVLYELLDENSVWQWRVARLLRIDSVNDRVCLVVPLTPKNTYDPSISNAQKSVAYLAADQREVAQTALEELANAKQGAAAKEDALNGIVRALHAETEEIKKVAGEISDALRSVVPLLENAKKAVGSITTLDLTEMRSYPTPPPIVMRVLEAVKIILEDCVPKGEVKWKDVKQFIRGNDFVPSVRDYSATMSAQTCLYLQRTFINEPSFTSEAASRASAAAGPLYQWVHAQCRAAVVQDKIKPLMDSHHVATERLRENERKEKQLEDEQQSVQNELVEATKRYQKAVYGFDFLLPAKSAGGASKKESVQAALVTAHSLLPFIAWAPSLEGAPTRILVSTIMAKCI